MLLWLRLQWLQRLLGVLRSTPRSKGGSGGGQSCDVLTLNCRYQCSKRGQLQTHAVMRSRAWSKSQSQLWANWQLQGPWQLVYTPVAAGPHQGLVTVEAGDGNWTRGVQSYRWRGYLPVNAVILAPNVDRQGLIQDYKQLQGPGCQHALRDGTVLLPPP